MDFLKLCADRYSARSYDENRSIPDEVMAEILEAGRLAPTAMNIQSQRVFVIKSKEALDKLHTVKKCFGAPVVLMVCGDTDIACNRPKVDHCMAEMDASIVTTHMMLAAENLGIGTCWICSFNVEALAEVFDLPANLTPYVLLAMGYRSSTCEPSPRHEDRHPLEHTVSVL